MQELYEGIRKDAEEQGYSMTDEKFTELVRYAERKAAVAGKDESYIPYLLPDVIKEYFIRNAINEVSTGMMEFERYIKTQKQPRRLFREQLKAQGGIRQYLPIRRGSGSSVSMMRSMSFFIIYAFTAP